MERPGSGVRVGSGAPAASATLSTHNDRPMEPPPPWGRTRSGTASHLLGRRLGLGQWRTSSGTRVLHGPASSATASPQTPSLQSPHTDHPSQRSQGGARPTVPGTQQALSKHALCEPTLPRETTELRAKTRSPECLPKKRHRGSGPKADPHQPWAHRGGPAAPSLPATAPAAQPA